MDNQTSDLLKSKKKYLHFVYKITEHIIVGRDPSDEMIKKAEELGRLAEIPEDELLNLGLIKLHRATI
jgi:hypothetical protein